MTRNFASLAIYLVALMTLNSGLTVDVQQSKVSLRDWIPLTETEALKYLTTHELAVVHNRTQPSSSDTEQALDAWTQTCHSYIKECPNKTSLLLKHRSTRPETLGLIDIINTMKMHYNSKHLVFVGDSLTRQSFWTAYCTLHSHGVYKADTETVDSTPDRSIFIMKIKLAKPVDAPLRPSLNETYDFYIYCYFYAAERVVSFTRYINEMGIALKKARETMEKITYVINIGLHYNEKDATLYKRDLKPFLQYFLNCIKTRGDLVLFRETTAQHFDSSDGLYVSIPEEGRLKMSSYTAQMMHTTPGLVPCKPITNHHEQNWRNRAAREVLESIDQFGLIRIIEFYKITASRYDLHLLNDCTHYCQGPLLWVPLWDAIAHMVKRYF